jgi:hypothetical protein
MVLKMEGKVSVFMCLSVSLLSSKHRLDFPWAFSFLSPVIFAPSLMKHVKSHWGESADESFRIVEL